MTQPICKTSYQAARMVLQYVEDDKKDGKLDRHIKNSKVNNKDYGYTYSDIKLADSTITFIKPGINHSLFLYNRVQCEKANKMLQNLYIKDTESNEFKFDSKKLEEYQNMVKTWKL